MILYSIETIQVGTYWIVASDPTSACERLAKYLNDANYSYAKYREVKSIQVIATSADDVRFITDKKLVL